MNTSDNINSNTNATPVKIGIPKAFLYYKYAELYTTFFKELGHDILLSPDTNREIFTKGISLSIDESCLPSKIYLGHVDYLLDKCDLVFIPRVANYGCIDKLCAKFYAIYDIVVSTFLTHKDKILDFNIDYINGKKEKQAFMSVGKKLGHSKAKTLDAYNKATAAQLNANKARRVKALEQLKSDKTKILVLSHNYNMYDEYVGVPVVRVLKKQGVEVISVCDIEGEDIKAKSIDYSDSMYWKYSRELVGALSHIQDQIDGIVIITAFPCGPDSLVNDLLARRQKKLPMINLVIDELAAEGGLETRIEAFIDMLGHKKLLETNDGGVF